METEALRISLEICFMGELNDGRKNEKSPGRKKRSIKVDLTPMVDLGFILITFFIFTTSMSEPKSMKLRLPASTIKDSMQTAEGKTINLILSANHEVWVYTGKNLSSITRATNGSHTRKLINQHKQTVASQYGDANEQVVLIKPTPTSSYMDVVDILDEMLINQIGRYVLMEPSPEELQKLDTVIP